LRGEIPRTRRRSAREVETLERGGDSLEGLGPSNEAENCSRGAVKDDLNLFLPNF
jgi:hypothetical protein